ncbi:MAG TPA: hypothetical protein VG870_09525 [Chitinophagaceae bacterium]|nr:hypothetical protein [Chitinophagaceae bacterium]
MKTWWLTLLASSLVLGATAQTYPDPEFSNEIWLLKKEGTYSLVRLEKNISKMETKTKFGGIGGSENGYTIEGEKSPVRFNSGDHLSFVYSTGAAGGGKSAQSDSMMRANGVDPSMMPTMGSMNDPQNMISLYRTEVGKGQRKVLLQKSPGALPFSSHRIQSSDKYTFSVRKIRDGYWELSVDKSLPRGEYAFTMMDYSSMSGPMGGMLLFAFAID